MAAAFSSSSFAFIIVYLLLLLLLHPMMMMMMVVSQKLPSPPLAMALKAYRVPSGGAEAFAFDREGRIYIGVNDGRILRFEKHHGFLDFAYTAPNRTKKLCDGRRDLSLGSDCGRPLGMAFHFATNQLYIADGYYGLCVVGPKGGLATQILNSCEGVPFKFADGIDVDQTTGKIYLTDVSAKHSMGGFLDPNRNGTDSSGRVVEYDPKTKIAKVLVQRLQAPAGVAVSKDSSSILFTIQAIDTVNKYWLKGPKANTTQVVMNISMPDDITPINRGKDFWVCAGVETNSTFVPMGVKIDEDGMILRKVIFGKPFEVISEVHEFRGHLYVTSVGSDFIGIGRL